MKTFRQSLIVAALLASLAGLQSTATSAAVAVTAVPPIHSVTGCCYYYIYGKWMCIPC
jgi:hypothetical protein